MGKLVNTSVLPPSSLESINLVRRVEEEASKQPQVDIETQHVLHGGVYTRTICVPAGVLITGALIKIPTTLTVSGECLVMMGDKEQVNVFGFMVMPASANRKQAFLAYKDTYISMSFKTDLTDIEDIEKEFTDEVELLKSHVNKNTITITGE